MMSWRMVRTVKALGEFTREFEAASGDQKKEILAQMVMELENYRMIDEKRNREAMTPQAEIPLTRKRSLRGRRIRRGRA